MKKIIQTIVLALAVLVGGDQVLKTDAVDTATATKVLVITNILSSILPGLTKWAKDEAEKQQS